DRIEAQREVGRQHAGGDLLVRIERVRHRALAGIPLRLPLLRAGGALGQLPLVLERMLEDVVAPRHRRPRPGHLEAARDGVGAFACTEPTLPAEALLFEVAALGLWPDVGRGAGAVRLAERVTAGNERHGLVVVHRHAAKRLTDVARGRQRIWIAVGPFGIHVDEAHLHGRERIGELAVTAVALGAQPRALGSPVDVLRLPHVFASTGEAERLEPHRLERDVAGQHHQIGPRDLAAVLLLHRPQQTTGLVEVRVVGPAAERGEPKLPRAGAAATVVNTIGARAVPGHADEQTAVVAEV